MNNNAQKFFRRISLVITIIILIAIPFSNASAKLRAISQERFLMDTIMQLKINVDDSIADLQAQNILNSAFEFLAKIDSLLSIYNSESEISRVNANSGKSAVKVDAITLESVLQARKFYDISEGVFNPLIGSVTKLWKINRHDGTIPSKSDLESAIELSNITNLELTREPEPEIFLKSAGCVIDLGGIAKGFASEKVAEYIRSTGVKSALINLGGNVYVIGKNIRETNWVIGVQNPLSPRNKPALVLGVSDCAVVTSGNYERYKIIDGKRYSHFFDPMTGESVNSNMLSVTIISPDGSMSDALATAFMISGFERSVEILRKMNPAPHAVFIQQSESESASNDGGLVIFADEALREKIISSEFPVKYY